MSINLSSKTSLSSATAAAVLALTVAAWPLASQAQRGHDGHTGGGASFSGGHASGQARSAVGDRGSGNRSFGFRAGDGHRGHFRRRHNGVAFGFYDDDYGYGYSSSCEYYRQRALNTGRSYWWRRYRACIAD